jgi:Spy/CpxP family protein refolding chaperone
MVLAFAVTTLLVAGLALAQEPEKRGPRRGGPPPGGMGGPPLLLNKSVQEELKLTPEQVEKVRKLTHEMFEKYHGRFEKLRDLQGEERFHQAQELTHEIHHDMRQPLSEILNHDQLRRFYQIELQQNALWAITAPKVRDHLKLTEEQVNKIRSIRKEAGKEMHELMENRQGDREETFKKFQELRRSTMKQIFGVLNDDQRATWKEMVGERFHVRYEGGPPGGGERKER